MFISKTTTLRVSTISLLRATDILLTLHLLSINPYIIELNIFWDIMHQNFLLAILIFIAPILLYTILKSYKKSYFLIFLTFSSFLIIYELILIFLS